jgi:hypothetical protein
MGRQHLVRYRMHLLLGAAVLLVLLNLFGPAATDTVGVVQRTGPAATAVGPAVADASLPKPAPPGPLQRPMLEPAVRDPFAPPAPPPVVVPVAKVVVPPPSIAVPVVPSAPPHNLSFAGRMTAPDGRTLLYVSAGEGSMAIAVGQMLPNGYRVEAITEHAIELIYPPLNTTARLDLPAPPKYEIR